MEESFQYRSEIHEIPNIRKDLGELESAWKISESKMRQIRVIVEELFSNIVRFGYEDAEEHVIEVRICRNENVIEIEIIDDGIAFNPLEYSEDTHGDPALVELGGMGLTLVRTFSSNMSYQRIGDKNQLKIEKKI